MSLITRFNNIKLLIQRLLAYLNYYEPIEGEEAIHLFGHRGYVGGLWNEIGRLQFEFLLKSGLKKSDCLFDIGCGSLRGGVHFIRYLNKGNYVGIDKNLCLIQTGIKNEMKRSEISDKSPVFIDDAKFDFSKIKKIPDLSIAQSLFTHLNLEDLSLCLMNLRKKVPKGHNFFATYKEGNEMFNRKSSNSFSVFYFSFETLSDLANNLGWKAYYIGDWGHPRNQKMIKFLAV